MSFPFLALDKLFLLILFLGMSYFESSKYLFHVFAIVIIGVLNKFLLNLDLKVFMSFFTLSFGMINIFRNNYNSSIYNFVMIFVALILFKRARNSSLYFLMINAAIGIAVAVLYNSLLYYMGFQIKTNDPVDNEETVCVEYDKNDVFVKYV